LKESPMAKMADLFVISHSILPWIWLFKQLNE
jgi:hypothetical protein